MRLRWWRLAAAEFYVPGMMWPGGVAITELLGGISQLLGGAAPASPSPALPPAPPYPGTTPQSPPYPGIPWPAPDGASADAARQVDDALQNNHSAVNDADAQMTDAILHASASDQQGKAQLQGLQRSVVDEVKKLGPSLDSAAGQQQLADFLQGKTAEILDVVKTAGLDATSHAAVLDALAARYRADGGQRGAQSADQPAFSAPAPAVVAPRVGEELGPDPLADGLASDPLLAGPGLGALGGLPTMMGPMFGGGGMPLGGGGMPLGGGGLPLGGGGMPLGDLGSSIGGAIRDAVHGGDTTDKSEPLKDEPLSRADTGQGHDTAPLAPLNHQKSDPGPRPPAGLAVTAPVPGPPPADTTVTLPDGTSATADSPAVANAGRAVLAGADITDAYQQAGIALAAAGTAVTAPVSPSKLVFGDVGQYTDHQVMALGGGKVWVNGQVSPLDQLDTGPNFLGWEHPATAAVSDTGRRQGEVR